MNDHFLRNPVRLAYVSYLASMVFLLFWKNVKNAPFFF